MPGRCTELAVRLRVCARCFRAPPVVAVAGADLQIGDAEFFSMLGPSGSSKTTVLRMIAGFEEPTPANLFMANQAPVVNVVAVVLVLVSIAPVWLAQRLGGASAAESRLWANYADPMTERTFGQPATPRLDQHIERVLVVTAHPDDCDFGAAGTVAGWVDAGLKVTNLLCTHGEQGGFEDSNREQMPIVREREQIAASAALGVTDVRFLPGHRDGWLEPSWELQRQIVEVIREVQPQRVLIQSPERWYDRIQASHPDHLAAGEAAIRAIYPAAENRFAWPELIDQGLQPWHVNEIWIMAHPEMTHAVDITGAFARKVAALQAHVSQTGPQGDQLEGFLRSWGLAVAKRFGLGEGRLGECFAIMDLG